MSNSKFGFVPARNRRFAPIALGTSLLAALMLLNACGGAQTVSNPPQSSSSSSAVSTSAVSSSSSSDATSTSADATASQSSTPSTSDDPAARGLCIAALLTGSLDFSADSGAGQTNLHLIVTNKSTHSCILDGFPGVSLTAGGKQIGAPADRDNTKPSAGPITLAPNQSATAPLRVSQPGNFQGCTPEQADNIRLYPPSAYDFLMIPTTLMGCPEGTSVTMHIGAFTTAS